MNAQFYLDPDYKQFTPGVTRLKFETLGGLSGVEFLLFFGLWMAAIVLVYVPLTLIVGYLRSFEVFPLEDIEVLAIVTGCERHYFSRITFALDISYAYEVSGKPYADIDTIGISGNCQDFPANMPLEAKYLSTDPTQSRLTDPLIEPQPEDFISIICVLCMLIPLMLLSSSASVGFLLALVRHFLALRRYPRLQKSGQLIEGTIVSIKGSAARQSRSRRDHYYVRITYRFITPNRRTITNVREQQRDNLSGRPLPPVGTSVAVFYADDHAYTLL